MSERHRSESGYQNMDPMDTDPDLNFSNILDIRIRFKILSFSFLPIIQKTKELVFSFLSKIGNYVFSKNSWLVPVCYMSFVTLETLLSMCSKKESICFEWMLHILGNNAVNKSICRHMPTIILKSFFDIHHLVINLTNYVYFP